MVSTAMFTTPVNTFACNKNNDSAENQDSVNTVRNQIDKKRLTRRKVARRFWSIASSSDESMFIGI